MNRLGRARRFRSRRFGEGQAWLSVHVGCCITVAGFYFSPVVLVLLCSLPLYPPHATLDCLGGMDSLQQQRLLADSLRLKMKES